MIALSRLGEERGERKRERERERESVCVCECVTLAPSIISKLHYFSQIHGGGLWVAAGRPWRVGPILHTAWLNQFGWPMAMNMFCKMYEM